MKDQVEKVAHLARLELTSEEIESIGDQLQNILKNFEKLNAVDTSGVEPLVTPSDIVEVMGHDNIVKDFSTDDILSNAPERSGNLFKVPPVV